MTELIHSDFKPAPRQSTAYTSLVRRVPLRIVKELAEQKMNDGSPVPFFGRPAMTTPALAVLALRSTVPCCRCESNGLMAHASGSLLTERPFSGTFPP